MKPKFLSAIILLLGVVSFSVKGQDQPRDQKPKPLEPSIFAAAGTDSVSTDALTGRKILLRCRAAQSRRSKDAVLQRCAKG